MWTARSSPRLTRSQCRGSCENGCVEEVRGLRIESWGMFALKAQEKIEEPKSERNGIREGGGGT